MVQQSTNHQPAAAPEFVHQQDYALDCDEYRWLKYRLHMSWRKKIVDIILPELCEVEERSILERTLGRMPIAPKAGPDGEPLHYRDKANLTEDDLYD